MSEAHVKGKLC